MAKVIMIHKNSFVSSNVTQPFFSYCTLKKETNNIENKSPLLLLILQLTRLRTFYENPFLYLEISS